MSEIIAELAAFAIIGAVLYAGAYIYAKLKNKIEDLKQKDKKHND